MKVSPTKLELSEVASMCCGVFVLPGTTLRGHKTVIYYVDTQISDDRKLEETITMRVLNPLLY